MIGTNQEQHQAFKIPPSRHRLYEALANACRPRPVTSVTRWSDNYRILSSKGSSEPGRWNTDRTPYLAEIQDHLSVTSPTQRIVMMFATQLGKTECGLNWIGYVMDHAPSPMLVVVPTLEVRKRWVRQRFDPMIGETPQLSRLFDARKTRDGSNAEDMKDFPGGMLVLGGANSASSLASMPIKYVLCDEIDRFPWDVGGEGDPLGLIDERTKTFPRRKVLLVSTPTIKGQSRIEMEYEKSDMRQYHVPCPHCGEYQVLRWRHDNGNYGLIHNKASGRVFYACVHNGCEIDEHHKPAMLAAGRWIARHPERKTRGYHMNALYAPLGLGFTWSELWQKWEDAHGDSSNLKRFINTTLAETWEEQGDSVDDLALIARLEDYPENRQTRLTTSFTDVQKDRLETTVVEWGAGEEGWTIAHEIHPGDTAMQAVWDDLDEYLRAMRIDLAGIDAGYNTSMVYAFCEKKRWCIPTKGVSGMNRPLIEDERKRRQRMRTRRKKGTYVEPLGVDQGKALVYARLKLTQPGPGYIHFPREPDFDDEYFAQLAAEKLVTKVRGTRPFQEWVQTRPRNEALDCMVGNLAMVRLSGVDLDKKKAGKDQSGVAQKRKPIDLAHESHRRKNTIGRSKWR